MINKKLIINFENQIAEGYMKKIRLYFFYQWILLLFVIILFIFSLVNYIEDIPGGYFGMPWKESLILAFIFLPLPIIRFIVTDKVKKRLIWKIIFEDNNILLFVYDGTILKIDKSSIPFKKENQDYYFRSLFSSRGGTIFLDRDHKQKFIININRKKYYLAPAIFEQEMSI